MVLLILATSLNFLLAQSKPLCEVSLYEGKEVISKSACNNALGYELISKSCLNLDCKALKTYRAFKNKTINKSITSVIGNPLHVKCRTLGGMPLMVNYKLAGKTFNTSICQFDDESYLSI